MTNPVNNNKKRVRKCFRDFIDIMDTKSNYYIMFSHFADAPNGSNGSNDPNTNKVEKINNNANTNDNSNIIKRYVSKNADDVPLPLPRDNPECIYHSSSETHETGDAGENAKLKSKIETEVEVIKVDIDDKRACYDANCLKCGHRIPFKINKIDIDVEIKNIGDLIKLCNDYKLAENIEYNANYNATITRDGYISTTCRNNINVNVNVDVRFTQRRIIGCKVIGMGIAISNPFGAQISNY